MIFKMRDFIEFDSMINLRPYKWGQVVGRGVDDENIQKIIIEIVSEIVN